MINSHANLAKKREKNIHTTMREDLFYLAKCTCFACACLLDGAASLLRCSQFREICEIRVSIKPKSVKKLDNFHREKHFLHFFLQ